MTLYHEGMPDQSSKRRKPRDLNKLAAAVVSEATGDIAESVEPNNGKDPAAVELGRRGGLKGGKARAAKLTAQQRSEIAKKAAQARWSAKGERHGS
jgi:hypothetical protein